MDPTQPERPTEDRWVHGIVLAGGRSRRMGRAKTLLEAGGSSFIERAVSVLRGGGCGKIVAVVGPEGEQAARLARAMGARIVVNPDPAAEQIDSLRVGLATVSTDAAGALVLPVDQPLVRPTTVAAVIAAFQAHGAPVVRPTYRGEPGHPTLFARRVFGELSEGHLPGGARAVVRAHAEQLEDVPVEDPGIVADIDTPGDYRRYVESARGAGGGPGGPNGGRDRAK